MNDIYAEEPLPQAVIDAAPGEVVTAKDGHSKHDVWVDGEMIGTVFDESAAKLERGAFAAWSPKCRNKGGIVGFYGSLEDAADAIAGKAAEQPAELDIHVVSFNGGKVHTLMPGMEEHPWPLCRGGGMNQVLTQFQITAAPLSCTHCVGYAERRSARLAKENQ